MGKSESVGSATDLFHAFKKDFRLYLPKPGTVSRLDFGSRMPSLAGNGPSVAAPTVTIENDVEKETGMSRPACSSTRTSKSFAFAD
jgi:hypothetical protein